MARTERQTPVEGGVLMLGWNPAPNRMVSILNELPQEEFESVTGKLLKEMRFNITNFTSTGKYLEFEATSEGDDLDRVFIIRASRGTKRVRLPELSTGRAVHHRHP